MPILNSVWKRVCGHRLENVSPLEVNLIIAGPVAAMKRFANWFVCKFKYLINLLIEMLRAKLD